MLQTFTVEFEKFYLVNIYTPNAKRELERLNLREKLWDPEVLKYLKELENNYKEQLTMFVNSRNNLLKIVSASVNKVYKKLEIAF